LSLALRVVNHGAGVRVAASRKLEHELGIPQSQTPVDEFQYLTRIQYLAPSNGLWGEHEGELSTLLLYQTVARRQCTNWKTVDYILFFTGDVDVTPNLNEISGYKYVSKTELQQMFEDPGMFIPS
jgi:isopentenyl-diphosphate delta-isomerase